MNYQGVCLSLLVILVLYLAAVQVVRFIILYLDKIHPDRHDHW